MLCNFQTRARKVKVLAGRKKIHLTRVERFPGEFTEARQLLCIWARDNLSLGFSSSEPPPSWALFRNCFPLIGFSHQWPRLSSALSRGMSAIHFIERVGRANDIVFCASTLTVVGRRTERQVSGDDHSVD